MWILFALDLEEALKHVYTIKSSTWIFFTLNPLAILKYIYTIKTKLLYIKLQELLALEGVPPPPTKVGIGIENELCSNPLPPMYILFVLSLQSSQL